jgi:hypothetical protein
MAKEAAQKLWIRPELKRLGEIKDVAAGTGTVIQGQPNRS